MIKIEISADGFNAKLDSMHERLAGFSEEVRAEFLTWQADDMNRREPTANDMGPGELETTILPRGPRTTRRERPSGDDSKGLPKQRLIMRGRPILRPELFEALCSRMSAKLGGIKWG